MKTILQRYKELDKVNSPNFTSEDDIFDVINEEYFNDELKISFDCKFESYTINLTATTAGVSVYYYVNDRTFTSVYTLIEYLQSIYDLKHIEKQIKRIYEIN
jgi:hypothetical protein